MPFTNIDTIRQHLADSEVAQARYRDVPVRLNGTSSAALLHRNLLPGSVVVKGKEAAAPLFSKQNLDLEPTFLGKKQLIPDSVAIASDSSLGTIYTENVDYQVDYAEGTVSLLSDGSVPVGSEVAIWFYAFTIYQEGADYFVNGEQGTIRRANGSQIEDGQVVFVDYTTTPTSFSDAQIENAVIEANDRLKRQLAAEHHHSADQSLISAETYLALAILFRISAAAALQSEGVSRAATSAREWRDLAALYEKQAIDLAAGYTKPQSALTGPTGTTTGGKR